MKTTSAAATAAYLDALLAAVGTMRATEVVGGSGAEVTVDFSDVVLVQYLFHPQGVALLLVVDHHRRASAQEPLPGVQLRPFVIAISSASLRREGPRALSRVRVALPVRP